MLRRLFGLSPADPVEPQPEAKISREQVIARLKEKMPSPSAETPGTLREYSGFAQGLLGAYCKDNPESWKSDTTICSLIAAASGANFRETVTSIRGALFLDDVNAKRAAGNRPKEIHLQEQQLMDSGILPPITMNMFDEVMALLTNREKSPADKLSQLQMIASRQENCSIFFPDNSAADGNAPPDAKPVSRYAWVDSSHNPEVMGLVSIEVTQSADGTAFSVKPTICRTANSFFVARHPEGSGFDIIVPIQGQFHIRDHNFSDQTKVIEPVKPINFFDARQILEEMSGIKKEGTEHHCPSCSDVTACGAAKFVGTPKMVAA